MSGSDPLEYRVGKGKPPVDTRFPKGKSGNPKGRPRAKDRPTGLPPTISMSLLKSLEQPITITRGRTRARISKLDAIIEQLIVRAAQGDVHAIKLVLKFVDNHQTQIRELRGKLFTKALDLKLERTSALKAWVASGGSEEDLPLHPDDIELDPITLSVKALIPLTREDKAIEQELIDRRAQLETTIALTGRKPKYANLRRSAESALEVIEQAMRPTLKRKR